MSFVTKMLNTETNSIYRSSRRNDETYQKDFLQASHITGRKSRKVQSGLINIRKVKLTKLIARFNWTMFPEIRKFSHGEMLRITSLVLQYIHMTEKKWWQKTRASRRFFDSVDEEISHHMGDKLLQRKKFHVAPPCLSAVIYGVRNPF